MLINQHSNDITLMGFINRVQFVCYEGRKSLQPNQVKGLAIDLEQKLFNSNDCNSHNG